MAFETQLERLIQRTTTFMHDTMWLPTGIPRQPVLLRLDDYDAICATPAITIAADRATKCIYVFFNP